MNALYRALPSARPWLSSGGRRRLWAAWVGRGKDTAVPPPAPPGVDKEQEWRAYQHGEAVLQRQMTPPRGRFAGSIDLLVSAELRDHPRIHAWRENAGGGVVPLELPGSHSTYLVQGAARIAELYRRRIDASVASGR